MYDNTQNAPYEFDAQAMEVIAQRLRGEGHADARFQDLFDVGQLGEGSFGEHMESFTQQLATHFPDLDPTALHEHLATLYGGDLQGTMHDGHFESFLDNLHGYFTPQSEEVNQGEDQMQESYGEEPTQEPYGEEQGWQELPEY